MPATPDVVSAVVERTSRGCFRRSHHGSRDGPPHRCTTSAASTTSRDATAPMTSGRFM
jgi:hypothetical protein